jgi:hypothetical protein
MGNVNKMKEKWANKEAKVWFMEAQKWTQHLLPSDIHLDIPFSILILFFFWHSSFVLLRFFHRIGE